MHRSVTEYVGRMVAELELTNRSHLDIGSLNVNGSNRQHFSGVSVGVDIREGPGVDQVANAHALPFADGSFAVITCTEMLEHDSAPWQTVREIARILQPGGTAILTARGFDERGCFPVHDYPGDHWRFSVTGFGELLSPVLQVLEVRSDPECPGVFAVARRP